MFSLSPLLPYTHTHSPVSTKKMHGVRVQVRFYLGQNEDCSPGGAPQTALRNCSKERVGESQYV